MLYFKYSSTLIWTEKSKDLAPNNFSVEPSWHADGDKARCVCAGGVAQTWRVAALADSNFLSFSFHGPDEQGKLCLSSELRSRSVVAQTVTLPNGTDHLMICGSQACKQEELRWVTADDIRPWHGVTAGRQWVRF